MLNCLIWNMNNQHCHINFHSITIDRNFSSSIYFRTMTRTLIQFPVDGFEHLYFIKIDLNYKYNSNGWLRTCLYHSNGKLSIHKIFYLKSRLNSVENKEFSKVLEEEIDDEVLQRLPEWFRTLRKEYQKQKNHSLVD